MLELSFVLKKSSSFIAWTSSSRIVHKFRFGFPLISLLFMTVMNFVPEAIFPTPLTSNRPSCFWTLPPNPLITPLALILCRSYFLPISKHVQEWSGSMNHFFNAAILLSSKTFLSLNKIFHSSTLISISQTYSPSITSHIFSIMSITLL